MVLTGPQEDLSAFLQEQVVKDEEGRPFLDFNRVLPRPEALEGAAASNHDEMAWTAWYGPDTAEISEDMPPLERLAYFHNNVEYLLDLSWVKEAKVKTRAGLKKFLIKMVPNAKEVADRLEKNIKNYGAMDWYQWSLKNWGTKWNSKVLQIEELPEGVELVFDTAWSPPEPIFKELSRLYPRVRMDITSFDEGWNFACEGYYHAGTEAYECGDATPELYEKVYGVPPPAEEEDPE